MKKKLYIETSVWNQLYGNKRPEWTAITKKFMKIAEQGIYEIYISNYLFFELEECYQEKKDVLLEWIKKTSPIVLEADDDCENLMSKYFEAGVLNPTRANKYYDAAHAAVCSVYGIEYLLTFNFKHMLKIKKIEGFNGVNLLNGYGEIKLVTPEIFIPEEE